MPTAMVRNLKNKEVGEVSLSDAVFGVELNEPLIHAAVRNYLANRRQGTSATKTRGNVRGGGKKPWKQKGTGRARVASIRSPLWRGGGRTHGPQPRDWSYNMPKKMRRGALRSALSERLREGNIIIIDDFSINNTKTKDFVAVLGTLGFKESKKPTKILIVDSLENENLILSSRNVPKTKVTNGFGLNVYDLIYHEKLLISKSALDEINHLLDPKREQKDGIEPDEVKSKEQKTVAKKDAGAAKPKAKKEKPKAKKEAKPAAKKAAKPKAKKETAPKKVDSNDQPAAGTDTQEEATDNE